MMMRWRILLLMFLTLLSVGHGEEQFSFDEMNPEWMIIYQAEEERAEVTLFTDIFCPYCRAFHKEIESLLEAGITVRYLSFPLIPESTQVHEAIWCNENPHHAFDRAMLYLEMQKVACPSDEVISAHRLYAKALGVFGTPTIFDSSGKRLNGYLKGDELIKILLE